MMKKVKLQDIKPGEVPGHFGMVSFMLHGKEEGSQRFRMGLSHFLPGGGAVFGHSQEEKVYFVLNGELTIKADDQEIILGPWESIYIGSGEGREIINRTAQPASILVVIGSSV